VKNETVSSIGAGQDEKLGSAKEVIKPRRPETLAELPHRG